MCHLSSSVFSHGVHSHVHGITSVECIRGVYVLTKHCGFEGVFLRMWILHSRLDQRSKRLPVASAAKGVGL